MHAPKPVDPRVKYKRIILKLSGELLRGEKSGDPIDADALERTCKQVKEIHDLGVEIGVVIGGGNIFRVQSAIPMNQIAEPFILRRAIRHLEKGRVVIFVAGTGNPYFSTDTTAALRASEMRADVIVKATKVDGIYDKDPKKYSDAVKYDEITFIDALKQRLKVMDSTAFSLCLDNHVPILVLDLHEDHAILRGVTGKKVGTLVHA
jgi:uridylate kinase